MSFDRCAVLVAMLGGATPGMLSILTIHTRKQLFACCVATGKTCVFHVFSASIAVYEM
jgi:hypothetical protein